MGSVHWQGGRLPAVARRMPSSRLVRGFQPVAARSRLTRLGPGLSEQVAVLWTLPEKALTQGDSITVRVWQKQFRELMVTYGKTWVDSLTDYGQVVVPVRVPQ